MTILFLRSFAELERCPSRKAGCILQAPLSKWSEKQSENALRLTKIISNHPKPSLLNE